MLRQSYYHKLLWAVAIHKKSAEALDLKRRLDKMTLTNDAYIRKFRAASFRAKERGLTFTPHVGEDARQRFQVSAMMRNVLERFTKANADLVITTHCHCTTSGRGQFFRLCPSWMQHYDLLASKILRSHRPAAWNRIAEP
jgi:hypothetical protein